MILGSWLVQVSKISQCCSMFLWVWYSVGSGRWIRNSKLSLAKFEYFLGYLRYSQETKQQKPQATAKAKQTNRLKNVRIIIGPITSPLTQTLNWDDKRALQKLVRTEAYDTLFPVYSHTEEKSSGCLKNEQPNVPSSCIRILFINQRNKAQARDNMGTSWKRNNKRLHIPLFPS